MVQLTNRVIASLIASLMLMAPGVSFGQCVPAATWVAPGDAPRAPIASGEIVSRASARRIVLLGEQHDIADHHRWQLQMLAALHAARPGMVVGFEMFPRRVQGVLDRWVAGELTEAQFLAQTDWRNVWRLDASLYLPLFHWARMNRVPMIAININRELTREVSEKGFDAIPIERREGVSRPAEPPADYTKWLLGVYREHQRPGTRNAGADDPAFRRFVESQLLWDRAMAESLATAHHSAGNPLVVGILGSGHIARGYGVPHQLNAIGVTEVMSLLPWSTNAECGDLVAGYADAVYGLPAQPNESREQRARLGVGLERTKGGVLIKQVEASSIAAAAGVQAGDVVVEIAGRKAEEPVDVADAVQRQAPGTWLPIKILRQGELLDLIARFPPALK
ncbi:MAG: ChaN family lipoprotein [Burkholderiales bacterium]